MEYKDDSVIFGDIQIKKFIEEHATKLPKTIK